MPRKLKVSIVLLSLAGALLFLAYIFGIYSERSSLWPIGRGYTDFFRNQSSVPSVEEPSGEEQTHSATPNSPPLDEKVIMTTLHNVKVTKILDGWHDGHLILLDSNEDSYNLLFLSSQWMKEESLKRIEYNTETESTKVSDIYAIPGSSRGTGLYKSKITGKIFFSYIYVDERTCAGMSLNEIVLNEPGPPIVTEVHRTECALPPYGIHETGGIIAEDNKGALYLTVGDFMKPHVAADPNHSFGKLLIKKPEENKMAIYAKGFRNIQGLAFNQETHQLIALDHGPEAGDEVNFIEEGKDYGWPFVSYGKPYGGHPEEIMNIGPTKFGTHEGYERPKFVFYPSYGTKDIAQIPKSSFIFPNWLGDFLITTKTGIHRIRIRDDRVLLVEPLDILPAVRSLAMHESGLFFTASRPGIHLVRRATSGRN